ncbi:uncharacterized protein LAESUDRAFT_667875, partial [Laetiporus sulphureus 93-53]
GVLQPYRELGWWQRMYRLSPFTYLIEGMVGQAMGNTPIRCSSTELVSLNLPSGQTCSDYGGYITNRDATSGCEYCEFTTADEFLETSFNICYKNHWRDFGLFIAYIGFNVWCIYMLTYMFRIRSGSMIGSADGWLKTRIAKRK